MKKCLCCGKPNKRKDSDFCSRNCAFYGKLKVCERCGKEHHKRSKFCSKECTYEGKNYKEKIKICARCGKKHQNMRSDFCSASCCHSIIPSDETKAKMSKAKKEYFDTPEGMAYKEQKRQQAIDWNKGGDGNVSVIIDEFAVDIPTFRDLDDYSEFLDGFSIDDKW